MIAGRMEVWEFLSAWSEMYGLDCDQSFLGTINATFKDANVNMRRAMGDIVEDLDAKRRKANASLSKLASQNLPQAALGVRILLRHICKEVQKTRLIECINYQASFMHTCCLTCQC